MQVASSPALAAEGPCQAQVRSAAVTGVLNFPPRLRTAISLVLSVDPAADEAVEGSKVALCHELAVLWDVSHGACPHDLALGHVEQVRGPALQMVEDVGAIEDRGPPHFGLCLEETQDALPCVDVQVRGDLIHEVHRPRLAENLEELAPAPLAVREVIDQPVEAHLQDFPQVLTSGGADDAFP